MHTLGAEITNLLDLIPKKDNNGDMLIINYQKTIANKCDDDDSKARKRWKMLACALRRDSIEEGVESSRQFDGFKLVQHRELALVDKQTILADHQNWYEYILKWNSKFFNINVQHITRLWTPKDLIGYNNTGNICVWPSEETLSYYILENLDKFKDKWILELGGGMTCLAGFLVAKYGEAFLVHLTDGNPLSVENIKKSFRLNNLECFTKCSILKWENTKRPKNEVGKYDFILSADCLFFVDSHKPLLETISYYLAKGGQALMMAPKRKTTFNDFVNCALTYGFTVNVIKNYSNCVWQNHLQLLNSHSYNEDVHYPQLVILDWSNSSP